MPFLPDKTLTFAQLLIRSIRYYFPILKKTFLLIIIITLIKNFSIYFGMSYNLLQKGIIYFISFLIMIFFWAGMLIVTHAYLTKSEMTVKQALQHCWKRGIQIYFCILLYIVLGAIVFGIGRLLVWLVIKVWHQPDLYVFASIFLIGVPLFYTLVLTYFAFPLVVLEKNNALIAFRESIRLIHKEWFQVMGIYIFTMLIVFLVWPYTALELFMKQYSVGILYDFVVYALLLPVLANLTIFMLNDLRLRNRNSNS